MRLVNEWDPKQTGKIELTVIRNELDQVIHDYTYKINLDAVKVKETCAETIVEQVVKQKNYPGLGKEMDKPKILKSFALDIFCGLHSRNKDL